MPPTDLLRVRRIWHGLQGLLLPSRSALSTGSLSLLLVYGIEAFAMPARIEQCWQPIQHA